MAEHPSCLYPLVKPKTARHRLQGCDYSIRGFHGTTASDADAAEDFHIREERESAVSFDWLRSPPSSPRLHGQIDRAALEGLLVSVNLQQPHAWRRDHKTSPSRQCLDNCFTCGWLSSSTYSSLSQGTCSRMPIISRLLGTCRGLNYACCSTGG